MADLWRPGDIATLVCPACWAESREITGQTVAAGSIDRRDSGAMTALRTCERGHYNPAREAEVRAEVWRVADRREARS